MRPLPCWSRLPVAEQRRRALELVREIEEAARKRRRKTGKAPMGVRRILAKKPDDRPDRVATSPAPLVHASSPREWAWFKDRYYRFVDRFRRASARFLDGDAAAVKAFPARCFLPRRPTGMRWPRSAVA